MGQTYKQIVCVYIGSKIVYMVPNGSHRMLYLKITNEHAHLQASCRYINITSKHVYLFHAHVLLACLHPVSLLDDRVLNLVDPYGVITLSAPPNQILTVSVPTSNSKAACFCLEDHT
jgi:hypothetical protein